MLDTAVSESSPALAGDRIKQRHFGQSRASVQGAEHGTAVATILAGQVDAGFAGLFPQATLFAADVFDYGRRGTQLDQRRDDCPRPGLVAGTAPGAINVSIAGPKMRCCMKRSVA